jgi:hypothetical protein
MAKTFVNEMRAFHAEPNAIERDEIASRSFTRFGWLQAHRICGGQNGAPAPKV